MPLPPSRAPAPLSLIDVLEARAADRPEQRLYTFLDDAGGDDGTLTYAGLYQRARRIGAALQSLASPGERAVLLYPPGLEYVAGFFGCLFSGLIAVPAYPPDPGRLDRTLPRLRAIIEDARATAVLTTSFILSMGELLFEQAPELRALRWVATDELPPGGEDTWRRPPVESGALAFLQYTSGSTGAPKGVMLGHDNLLHNLGLISGAFQMRADSRGVIWLPPYHDMGLIGGILAPLYAGFPVALMSPLAFLKRPRLWLEALTRFQGTISGGPNFAFDLCVRRIPPEEREGLDLRSWEVAFCGAEPIRPETLDRFTAAFGPHGFRMEAFYPCYGLAEGTLIASGGAKSEAPLLRTVEGAALEQGRAAQTGADRPGARTLVGCGRTLPDQQILVVDPESLARCPPGAVGELWLSGPSIARGYWQKREETEQTFRARLADGAGPFLRTGDLGFLEGGELFVTGRLKDLIILRGRNLYPQDLELTVEQSHPALRPGCGAAFCMDADGEERLAIVQELDPRKLAGPLEEVTGAIRQRLAEAHEVRPHAVVLIEPGSVPKTSSGKVQRRACRAAFLAGELRALQAWDAQAPADRAPAPPAPPPPAGALEPLVLEKVAARLGLRREELDPAVPLTRYGLDSLAAVELAHSLERDLGVALPMDALLRGPSASELARDLLARKATAAGAQQALDRVPRTSALPLSFAQQRLWFLDRLEPGSAFYNLPLVVQLDGGLETAALERSLADVVWRHEALRAVFRSEAGEPVQRLADVEGPPLSVVELDNLPEAAREEEARRLAREEARRPFDLTRGPLLRATLLRLGARRHVLLLTLHHIAADGWSLRVLLDEVAALYRAHAEGRPPSLPELPLQYPDYAAWQRQWLRGERLEALQAWWRQRLAGAPPVLELPADRPRPKAQSYRGAQCVRQLPRASWETVKALGRREGVTPFVTLLAAFQLLLHRYTGQEDLVVGTDTAHRPRPETAGLIGLFVNQLALRGDLSGDPPFRELLGRSREVALDAFAHQDLPFDELVRTLNPERSLAHAPVFQVKLVLQDAAPTSRALPDLTLRSALADTGATKLDLTLSVTDTAGGLELLCEYSTDLFEDDTIARLLGHLGALLQAAAADPGRRLSTLPLLSEAERARALAEWSRTAPPDAGACAHLLFEARVALAPDALAVTSQERALTYRELDVRANRLAHGLRALGVGPDVVVGLHLERTPELVVGLLGILKAGGAFLPLDTTWPAERLGLMLREARVPVIVTREELADRLPSQGEQLLCLDADAARLDRYPGDAPTSGVSPAHLAYVLFTSGSTGTPKGALLEHRGLTNTARAAIHALGLRPGSRVLQLASPGFDASVWEIFSALLSGAELCLAPPEALLPGAPLQRLLSERGITALTATPTALAPLSPESLPALEAVASAGEACPPELAAAWKPGRRFLNAYGPTEATVCATVEPEVDPRRPSIGRAIPGARVYVLDERLEPVAVGVPGELYLGGPGLARGYLGRPALTAERFVPDPFAGAPGERLYRTGDVARYLPDGRIAFLGRRDAQVKVRGVRIELGDVEAALAQYPGVRQAVAAARYDGPEGARLVAYVVGAGGESPDAAALRRFLKERLPEALVPSAFVWLDALPLSPAGKVDRNALPAPEAARPALERDFTAPRTPLERQLASVWARVLQVERVGLFDHFFDDLGGSSLLVARASALLREELGQDVPVTHLFEHPTVHALAERLERERAATAQPLPAPVGRREARAGEEGADSDIAIIGMAGRFPGARDVGAFWRNLRDGVESISRFSPEELEPSPLYPEELRHHPDFVPAGGVLEGGDRFDSGFFDLSPREAQWMDPQQRVFLQSAWTALEDAGYDPERFPGSISLYAGAGTSGVHLLSLLGQAQKDPASLFEALGTTTGENVATKVSYKLRLSGESLNVYTACSTGLVAVHLACQSLRTRQSDLSLAGAVKLSLPQRTGYLYQEGMILSPDGHCRAFDAAARGTVSGHGVGTVVLKRLSDALRDADHIYAVIKGTAINNDAQAKVSYTAPSVQGQSQVIARALAAAGVDAGDIGYVEAHGTGTPLGDPIELAALTRAFRAHTDRKGYCALGSVKTNLGHLDTAAGLAGLIKVALALQHGELPPSLHFERPNPQIDFAGSPFFVNTALRPWERGDRPRRAGVSAFGIGGTNAHAVLEEAPPVHGRPSPRLRQLVTLSARTATALEAMTRELAARVEAGLPADLADLAFSRNAGRKAFEHRRAVVAADSAELVRVLRAPPPAAEVPDPEAARARRVAFLLPGQGAQSVRMGQELYEAEPAFRRELDACLELLPRAGLEEDLRALLFPEPGGEARAGASLAEARFALPALLSVEYALARLWMGWGLKPSALLGHSHGEYAAACLSGVLSLEDALRLAVLRGRLMSRLPPGGMLAVGLPVGELEPLLAGGLSLAAVNGAARCVASGPLEALEQLERELAARGAGALRLPTAHAFHSRAVEPLMPELEQAMAALRLGPPRIPYVSSLTGTWIQPEEATDPRYWARQLREPVRFAAGLDTLLESGCTLFIEAGPDQGLTALARLRLRGERQAVAVPSLRRMGTSASEHQTLLQSLGALWLAGAAVNWEGFYAHERRRRLPLPTYPFEEKRLALDAGPALPVEEKAAPAQAPAASRRAPRSEIERRLVELWRERLGVEEIGPDDNFLELGGNSLMAAQLLTRLRETFRVQLPLGDLFDAPTVAGLAARIEARLQTAPLAAPADSPAALALVRIDRAGELPLSYVQVRVWELEQQEPGSSIFNEPLAVRITGALEPAALEQAFNEVIRRHEALRTAWSTEGGRARQRIIPEARLSGLPVVDLRSFAGDRETEAMRLARLEPAEPFALEQPPLARVRLLRLADAEHVLLVTIHHIVADTLSLVNFIREAVALYTGLTRGRTPPLPELPIQYVDFAAWQRRALADGTLASQQAYWRRQLSARPGPLALPLDRPRVAGARRRGARHAFAFPKSLASAVHAFGQREGVTPFMALLAAFQALLARCSGQEDILVGTSIGNRTRPELEPLIGYVAHALALRTDLSGDPGFRELVGRIRDVTLAAYAHPDVPYEQLLGELEPGDEARFSRLFDAVFLLHAQSVSAPILEFPGLKLGFFDVTELPAQYGTALADLTLLMREDAEGFSGTLEYATELFDAATIARLLAQLQALLTEAVAQPERPLSQLSLETRAQPAPPHLLPAEGLPAGPLPALLASQAERRPEAVALTRGGRSLPYQALRAHAGHLAARLRARGVGPGTVVAVCLPPSFERAVALWGVLAAGGAYVLLGREQLEELPTLGSGGSAPLLLAAPGLEVPAFVEGARMLRLETPDEGAALPPGAPGVEPGIEPDSLACLVEEDGRPRAMLSHRNLALRFAALDRRLGEAPGATWLAAADADPAGLELLWALARGLRVALPAEAPAHLVALREEESRHRPLDFSLFYFAHDEEAQGRQKYQLLLEGAKFGDAHGFSAVWTPERHFHAFGGLYPSPTATSAALAAVTERIGIRAGSVVLPLHEPLRVAEEWSVIDNLSNGRAGVSFASGWNANDFVFAPENFGRRMDAIRRGVEEIRTLWSGGKVRRRSGTGTEVEVAIRPRPVQKELPIWITAAANPDTFRLAGELGAGLLTNLLGLGQDFEELARKVALYRDAWRRAGHGPGRGHVTVMLHTFIGASQEEVRRKAREPLLRYFRSSVELFNSLVASQGMQLDVRDLTAEDVSVLLDKAVSRYLEAGGLFGTPETGAARIEQLRRLGADEVACLIDFGLDREEALEGLRHLDVLRQRTQASAAGPARVPVRLEGGATDEVLALVRALAPAYLRGTAALVRALLRLPDAAEALRPVRTLVLDGGPLPADLAEALRRATAAQVLSPIPALANGLEADPHAPRYVLDALGRSAPVGVVGELCIGGGAVPLGFWNAPPGARARLIAPPREVPERQLYATGLSARYRADGGVELLSPTPRRRPAPPPPEPKRPETRPPPEAPIPRIPRDRPVPLSFAQQRLWYMARLEPESIAYNTPIALRMSGPLDAAAVQSSLNDLARRHEVLRTTYRPGESGPVQEIAPPAEVPLSHVALDAASGPAREAELARRIREQLLRPFDLERGPLFQAVLFRLEETGHVLLLLLHHILTDGWSASVLCRELALLYAARAGGRPAPLPALPIQYADYAVWQRQGMQGEALEAQLSYWRKQLAGAPPLELPTDFPRPARLTGRGASQSMRLPRELSQALKALGRRQGVTDFMVLSAGLLALLQRYAQQDDLTVGTPTAGRNRPELEGLIGCFVNMLVLRGDLSGSPSFQTLLGRVRDAALGAYAHQDVPFERLVEALHVPRALNRTPLFQVVLSLQNVPMGELALPGMSLSLYPLPSQSAKFDLTLDLTDTAEGFVGALEYRTDLFDAATARRMAAHLQALLEAAVARPELRLSEASLLSEAERRQLLVEWNETSAPYPREATLPQLFEAQVARAPEALALWMGEERLTYEALNRRANQLAHHLRSLGVGPESRVGVCLTRSPELVVAVLGILKAGGAFLPLDPSHPKERLSFMLEDAGAGVLLAQERLLERLPPHRARVLCLDTGWEEVARQPEDDPAPAATADNLAYVLYTSGSTGVPKGVLAPHRGAVNRLQWMWKAWPFRPGEVCCQKTALSFGDSLWEIFGPLLAGVPSVLIPDDVVKDPPRLVELLAGAGVTRLVLVPSLLQALLEVEGELRDRLSRLWLWVTSGERLPEELARRFRDRLPGATLLNLYGSSEVAADATGAEVEADRVTLGRPLANVRAYVLDAALRPVPVGLRGELHIGGEGLARGYLARPDLTAERFLPDPFSPEPGRCLYRTGDLARWLPDGRLESLGRADFQVKVRGFRIELGEVEAALRLHPAVQRAAVAARDDGPGGMRLVAYAVPAPGRTLDPRELRAFLKEKLPEYMVPSAAMVLKALPLTPGGKVDRKALPSPDEQPRDEASFVAPRTRTEERLAALWAQVLQRERVGVHDDFFEQGGHSLLATQLVSRIRAAFQVELPLREVFEAPTLEALAGRLDALAPARGADRSELPGLLPGSRQEAPLSFAQQRLWFLDQLQPGSALYNIPTALRLEGDLDVAALERSFGEILRRHQTLRTVFQDREGQPHQLILPPPGFRVPVEELQGLPAAEREAEVRRRALDEARRPFELSRGPLLRAALLRLGAREHALLVTTHHIASDGWSIGILVRELAALYEAFSAGRPSPLPELPIQYADHAAWQREWLQGDVLEAQVSYWRRQLEGAPPALELPTDLPRPAEQTSAGAQLRVQLPAALSEALGALARRESATLFMTLLAGLQALLGRYSGQEDLCVGAPIAGRRQAETEGLIGFFVNMLVLRTRLSGDPTFRELVGRVRDVALGAYAHQDVPFEKLVEVLQPERRLGHTPFFQVALVLLNTPASALAVPGLTFRPIEADSGTSKLDLTLSLTQTPQGLDGSLEYRTGLFEASTTARMMEHLRRLLEGAVADPERRLSELPLMSEAERHRVLVEWNATAFDYPRDACLHELFEAQARRTPDSVAVEYEGAQLTYRQLDERANRLAHHLVSRGVAPGDLVGICVERSLEGVVGLLSILKAGGAYVPLDPSYPRERLGFMLEDTRVGVVLAQARFTDRLPPHRAEVVDLDLEGKALAFQPAGSPRIPVSAQGLAYVIYTSGSTGRPKGVCIPHRAAVRLAMGNTFVFGPGEVILQICTLAFDASSIEVWGSLLHGARLVVMPQAMASLEELGRALVRHGVTTLFPPTPLYEQLVVHQPEALLRVRQPVPGGDVLSPAWAREHLLRGGRLFNGYGPTENGTYTTCYRMEQAAQVGASVSIGRPIANTRVYLLDAHLHPVPQGVPGELYAAGDGLAWGYLGRPELTAERFLPNPFDGEPGARMYRTGDRARYLPDGNLQFLGRRDAQVKVRGFRIELGELESALSGFPAVREVAVVAHGEGAEDKRLVAYVVPSEGQVAEPEALRAFLRAKLPEHMVPSVFVRLEALPLTPSGKLDRRALPKPDGARLESARPFVAPRTSTEERLARLLAQVLRLEQVGVHDDFFELGGHSLLATQLFARIRADFGIELPLRVLFEGPTVAGLARRLEATAPSLGLERSIPPLVPVPRDRPLPLSFSQERLWRLYQQEPRSTAYNIPSAFRLRGRADPRAVRNALQALMDRHESLRTTFAEEDGRLVQRVGPPVDFPFPQVDLRGHEALEAEVRRRTEEDARQPFDLTRGPLVRASLLQLQDEEHLLLLTMHHILSDGWSMGVLIQELATLYVAFSQGLEPALPPLRIQYPDYAIWQRSWLAGEVLEERVGYWKEALAGAPLLLGLPTDKPRPPTRTFQGTSRAISLGAERSAALNALCLRERVTPFMALLAAFGTVLAHRARQEEVVIGSPIANRILPELEPLIGLFVNGLALRVSLRGGPGFRELLQRVREVTLGAYAHQEVPFEHVVDALGVERQPDRSPVFQAMFVLQNAPMQPVRLPGLTLLPATTDRGGAIYELALDLSESPEGFRGELEFNTDLFEPATAERLAADLLRLLDAVLADPDRKVGLASGVLDA